MLNIANKKIILAGVIILLVLGGGFVVFPNFYHKKNSQLPASLEKELVVAQEIDKDSDNDGLKDWEEALWKTDPNNPDTDKDGTLDGQEIKENRNPLLASKNGKSDKFADALPAVKSETEDSQNKPLSLTEALSQQFFGDYLFLREKDGGQISQKSQEELIASFIGAAGDFSQPAEKFYLKSDIQIDSLETEKTIKEYGNNLALIIKKYFDPIPESEMTVFKKSMENENEENLSEMGQISAAYRNTAKEMLSLAAPQGFSDSHLNLTNYFDNIAKEIDAMQKSYDDPVQTLLALKQYQIDSVGAYQILRNLNDYFLNKKVVFETNEPAEFFKVYWE